MLKRGNWQNYSLYDGFEESEIQSSFIPILQGKTGYIWLKRTQFTRRKFTQGEIKPTAKAEVLATFPDYGLSYKYGGWHLTRTIARGWER